MMRTSTRLGLQKLLRKSLWSLVFIAAMILHLANGALHYSKTSTTLLPNNLHRMNKEKLITDMKNHIKQVLNMQKTDLIIDRYLSSIFNLNNPNPTYIFKLENQTLVFRKSDFSEAVFPNITNLNKFKRNANGTTQNHKNRYNDNKIEDLSELKQEKLVFDNRINDDLDEKLLKIIEENVRTERNFIKFMDDLNHDLEDEDYRATKNGEKISAKLIAKYHTKAPLWKTTTPKTNFKELYKPKDDEFNQKVNWDDLGLSGWSGGLKEYKSEFAGISTIESPPKLLPIPNTKMVPPKPLTALPKPLLTVYPLSAASPGHTNSHRPTGSGTGYSIDNSQKNLKFLRLQEEFLESEEVPRGVPEQLGLLLNEENIEYKNRTGFNKPKWPITNSRDLHRDDDVFIARANNPFGHSTKWKHGNSTDLEQHNPREGRSKRGVYNLYSMIKCATGCDPLIYKGYGCYCGFLGSGHALDGIDRCCKMHDYCYTTSSCPMFLEYFVPYLWKCYRGKALCALDHGEWGGPGSCSSRLCECDLALSKCLRRYLCPRKRTVCTSSPFRLLQNLIMVF